jgi:hypothetical protein
MASVQHWPCFPSLPNFMCQLGEFFFFFSVKVLASQKQLQNKSKAAQQASEDW